MTSDPSRDPIPRIDPLQWGFLNLPLGGLAALLYVAVNFRDRVSLADQAVLWVVTAAEFGLVAMAAAWAQAWLVNLWVDVVRPAWVPSGRTLLYVVVLCMFCGAFAAFGRMGR